MSNRLPAAARRRQLVAVATDVFAEHGYHDASMNAVAAAAGVTKPVLYQHFTSKRDLYLEVLADAGGRLRDAIEKAVADAVSASGQYRAGFVAYFRFVAAEPAAFAVLYDHASRRDAAVSAPTQAVFQAIMSRVTLGLAFEGLEPDEGRTLVAALVGLVEGATRDWIERGCEPAPEVIAGQLAALSWDGLRGCRASIPRP
jgi:AcrR family transcriptional regulator